MQRNQATTASGAALRRALRRGTAALLLPAVLLVAPGCYTYHAAELSSVRPGEEVRVSLREEGFLQVAPGAGAGAPRRLEGDLLRVTDDSVAVSVWIGEAYRGSPFELAHQEFSLPRSAVVGVEQRRLSAWRTAVAAAGVAVAIVALIEGIGLTQIVGDDGGGEPPPPSPVPPGLR